MKQLPTLRLHDYLAHIAQAISNIQAYTAGLDLQGFLADRKTQDAVVRNFEILGEACNRVTLRHPEFATGHPEVPWRIAYEMRNALAHGYFKVDLEIVWRTIHADLPALGSTIGAIRSSLEQ